MTPVISGGNKPGKGLGSGRPHIAVAVYDAAVDSKTEGEKTLRGDTIPAGAIITDTLLQVETALTSGGSAKVGVSVQSAGDVVANGTAISGAPWSTATPKRGAVTATSTPVATSAEKAVVAKIDTAALTAGKFRVLVTYIAT
jgi:hypothetical protein